ncbi:MAG: DUF2240 family protein [Candidatus Thermoplasmatota archaeon]
MTSDLVRTLAFAYKRRGADVMERAKLLHMLTFDLRWLSPDPTKRLVTRAIQAGLLVEEGEALRANFDAGAVEIPVNFRPRENVADDEGPHDAPPAKDWSPDPAAEERARRGGLMRTDVARLVIARRKGVDVREQARELEARLASNWTAPQ